MHAFTLEDFAIAFEKWENDYRVSPSNYYTAEQTATMQVSDVSANRAMHFMALLEDGLKK